MTGVAAIILAAGASRRFRAADPGVETKLVAELDGLPLVRHAAGAALASRAHPVIVVTGHARREVETALQGLDLAFAHNPDFAAGISTSLRVGLSALANDVKGALILLGDMPDVKAGLLDRLIQAFGRAEGIDAVVPVHAGRRGNPALIGRCLFGPAATLVGDEGARRLLARGRVLELETPDDSISIDLDDPDALTRRQRRSESID